MIQKIFVETNRGPVARVTFCLPDSMWAEEVYLVGDFNGWNYTSHPFQRDRQGCWRLTVDLELGRAYQFRYLRDGRDWMHDSQADACVHTRYGSDNFVVITDPHFKQYCDERIENHGHSNDRIRKNGGQHDRALAARRTSSGGLRPERRGYKDG